MMEQELLYASPEDIDFFNKAIEGLPHDPLYSCGAHSVRCLREIVEIVQPKRIFEIGFNVGRSSALWLALSNADVLSVDIAHHSGLIKAAEVLSKRTTRFRYQHREQVIFDPYSFDLTFIDGSHELDDVIVDIQFVLDMKITWIAFDDILPQYGRVQDAINLFPNLELVKVIGNIALYKNNK